MDFKNMMSPAKIAIAVIAIAVVVGVLMVINRDSSDQAGDTTNVISSVQTDNVRAETVTTGDLRFQVAEWNCGQYPDIEVASGNQICNLTVRVQNTNTDHPATLRIVDQKLVYNDQTYSYNPDSQRELDDTLEKTIPAQMTEDQAPTTIHISFEAPKPADNPNLTTGAAVVFNAGPESGTAKVDIKATQ